LFIVIICLHPRLKLYIAMVNPTSRKIFAILPHFPGMQFVGIRCNNFASLVRVRLIIQCIPTVNSPNNLPASRVV
jgi:hypothetical protein